MQRAFSLVELSIVLVILGLLTGGILAGQSLIRAAELRAVTGEYTRYITAVQTFKDKYFALPGDMANATSFWGDNNTHCADAAITNGSPGTCNGDGDGEVDFSGAASTEKESFMFWNQLAYAGLIEGSFDGICGSGGTIHTTTSNAPSSKVSTGLWFAYDFNIPSGLAYMFDGVYQNTLSLGGTLSNTWPIGGIFTPSEVWNIDTKLDDGKPGVGNMLILSASDLANCTDASGATAVKAASGTTSSYLLTSTTKSCAFVFRNQF